MNDDAAYLQHIRDAILRVREYRAARQEAFQKSNLIQDGVIRNLEIIGEAVKRLSPSAIALHPEIPWKAIAGMRDVLIHNYFGVKLEAVWNVVEHDLAVLETAIQSLLSRAATDSAE